MQLGLIISVLMHVAILGGALISIQSRAELRLPETEPVAVGMISPGDVTRVKQGVRTAKLLEAAEAKANPKGAQARKQAKRPTKTAAAAPPPPPPSAQEEKAKPPAPKAADPPPPEPAAEAQRKAAEAQKRLEAERQKQAAAQRLAEEKKQAQEQAKAEALQRAEEKKLAEEKKRIEEQKQADARKRAEEHKRLEEQRRQAELKKRREEAKKRREAALKKKREEARKRREEEKRRQEAEAAAKAKQFNADKIAALLNKVPNKSAPPPSSPPDQPTKAKGPTLGAAEGRDKIISASERALIGQVIKLCVIPHWRVLSGGASAQETVVKIRLRFNKDGTLSAPPVVANRQETPYFRAIAESALRAVQQCEPYSLPPSLYEHWRDIIMNFSPTDMF